MRRERFQQCASAGCKNVVAVELAVCSRCRRGQATLASVTAADAEAVQAAFDAAEQAAGALAEFGEMAAGCRIGESDHERA